MSDNFEGNEFSTVAIHSGKGKKKNPGVLVTPIYQSTSYVFDSVKDGKEKCESNDYGFCYTRIGNPTQEVLEEKIAALEGAESSLAFASGVAAASALLFHVFKAGDHAIVDDTVYSATHNLFDTMLKKFGVETTFTDTSKIENIEKAIRPNTRMIYFESPANPTMKVIDLEAVGNVGEKHNITTVVDSTFASPYLQNPIKLGIDVVIHSATKYICGHGDAMGGLVVGTKKLVEGVRDDTLKNLGGCISPFNAFLLIRGLKTLDIRMQKHCESALIIARYLENHPKVRKVFYPGLESHPQHEVAKKQMKDWGAVITFDLKGGMDAGVKLMEGVKLCRLAVSLGDVDTLVEHPASMTHWYIAKEEREKGGITDGLVRMSVGLEGTEDIINDLEQALSNC